MPASNQLTNITLAETGDSGLWGEIGGGQASSQDANVPLDGAECRARRVSGNIRGMSVGKGAIDVSAANLHIGFWVRTFQPGALNNVGLHLGGNAADPDNSPNSIFNFPGADYPREGPWIRLWLDPARARDAGAGTLSLAAVQYFGSQFDMNAVGGNAQNCQIDRIDYGTIGIEVNGASGTFAEAQTLDEANGLGILRDGELNGLLRTKNGQFVGGNASLRAGVQPLAAVDWIRWEIDNTDSGNTVDLSAFVVSLDGILVRVTGTVGTINLAQMSLLSAPAITLNSSVTFGGRLANSETLDGNGADLSGLTVQNTVSAVAVAVPTLEDLDEASFSSPGGSRAIDLGTISADTAMTSNFTATGYDAGSPGSTTTNTGSEHILVNVTAGNTLTITAAAGSTTPSVTNTGPGTVVVVENPIILSFSKIPPGLEARARFGSASVAYNDDVQGGAFEYQYTANEAGRLVTITIGGVDDNGIAYDRFEQQFVLPSITGPPIPVTFDINDSYI